MMIITIDGPAASGKTTVARMLAEALGFYYLGSGLLYRALAYLLRTQKGYRTHDMLRVQPEDVQDLMDAKKFVYTYNHGKEQIFFLGNPLDSACLRTPEIASDASVLAAQAVVRAALRIVQRAIADTHNLVVEGRDAGSVVFPDASLKFFITASVQERAHRFAQDQESRGIHITIDQAISLIEHRDARDKNRELDPLIVPDGAHVIDTTNLTPQQVVSRVKAEIQKTK
jgi:cytidylate kinase